jgi:hypothetical protein
MPSLGQRVILLIIKKSSTVLTLIMFAQLGMCEENWQCDGKNALQHKKSRVMLTGAKKPPRGSAAYLVGELGLSWGLTTFADTEILDNRLSFADQGNQNIPFPFAANKRITKTASNVLGQISNVFQMMTKWNIFVNPSLLTKPYRSVMPHHLEFAVYLSNR